MAKAFVPTVVMLLLATGLLTIYDIWAVSHNYDWTISNVLTTAGHKWLAIPFAFGFLMGHLFAGPRGT